MKHLHSMAHTVTFPPTLTLSHNFVSPPQTPPQPPYNLDSARKRVRMMLREYLSHRKESEMRRQLYKKDVSDSPWDYYQMLDAEWWVEALKIYSPTNQVEYRQFLWWIIFNNHHGLAPHWRLGCLEAYKKYEEYLEERGDDFGEESVLAFSEEAQLEGWFSAFKRDYLK